MSNTANSSYTYFLKGDISGIQDFIFNVKSEKAARVLKARSIFVQVLSEFTEKYIKRNLTGTSSITTFYNGGGAFSLFIDSTENLAQLEKEIKTLESNVNTQLQQEDIYISLSIVQKGDVSNFASDWKNIAIKSNKDKLRKSVNDASLFNAFTYEFGKNDWLKFAHLLPKKSATIESEEEETDFKVYEKSIEVFNNRFKLTQKIELGKDDFFNKKIQNKLPIWTDHLYSYPQFNKEILAYNKVKDHKEKIRPNHIIDYNFLAHFAKKRTGTKKIAILKMDVDNLGNLFKNMPNQIIAEETSAILSNFFEKEVNSLLDTLDTTLEIDNNLSTSFRDNIYTIFSGGDDCIFVGGWDAIFKWAALVKNAFDIEALKIEKLGITHPTISAGIVVVEPTYPVIRFAQLAEDALGNAKHFKFPDEVQPTKNKICVFDEVLNWEEFNSADGIASKLKDMIVEEGEPRGVIERIRNSAKGFKKLQEQALAGGVVGPSVAKLFYYIRHSKNKQELTNILIKPYANDLIAAFTQRKKTNPMKYPVAARWAEFLTRNKA